MSAQIRLIQTLGVGASRKRKEREGADGSTTPTPRAEPMKPRTKPSHPAESQPPPPALPAKNRLLAGYLAHEFLTRGTLFGEQMGPARAEQKSPVRAAEPVKEVYGDVAYLVKLDGTHIPGVVNPTQLGRWIQKGGL